MPKSDIELQEMNKKKDLDRLIELREMSKKADLDNEQIQELMRLQARHREFMDLSADEIRARLDKPGKDVSVESENVSDMLADFKAKYSKEPWYKEPEVKNGRTIFSFPSDKEAVNFFTEQAEQNRRFVLLDEDDKVLAYSNGDGTLRNSKGELIKEGDELTPGMDYKDFSMPENENRSSMSI